MMIRNVIFDVGNVLIEFDWQKFLRNLCNRVRIGVPAAAALLAVADHKIALARVTKQRPRCPLIRPLRSFPPCLDGIGGVALKG